MQEATKSPAFCGDRWRTGPCVEAKLEAIKTDIISGIRRMILGALVVQIAAEVTALFAFTKLVGH